MKKTLLLICYTILMLKSFGQNKKELDKQSIKAMCGLYSATFNYAETFPGKDDYEPESTYAMQGYEWIFVEEETPNKIVLQHILLIDDSTAMKHWREDWEYENTKLLQYDSLKIWHHIQCSEAEAAGTWTQKVFEVDDSPRYQCKGTWVYVDKKNIGKQPATRLYQDEK